MKNKYLIFLIVTVMTVIAALSMNVQAAKKDNIFTSQALKEFIISGAEHNNSTRNETLTPSLSGNISFSAPFTVPFYDNDKNKIFLASNDAWGSAVLCDGQVKAVAMFTYRNSQTILQCILYLPYDMTNDINSGENFSLFCVDFGGTESNDNGGGYFAVDTENNIIPVCIDSYSEITMKEAYNYIDNDIDHEKFFVYNKINNKMNKAVTVNYKDDCRIENGDIVKFKNASGEYLEFADSIRFIVRNVNEDENGRITFSISPENKPKSYIKASESNVFYLDCTCGGITPEYSIFPVNAPEKAITLSENGKAVVKKWTNDENQQWLVFVE